VTGFKAKDRGDGAGMDYAWNESASVLILSYQGECSAMTGTPTNGVDYSVGNTIGNSTVVADTIGAATSATASNFTSGEKYCYRAHAYNSSYDYSAASEIAGIPYNRTLTLSGYNMIGVPGELGAGVSKNTLFDDDVASTAGFLYWVGRYVSSTTAYEGRGYWLQNTTGSTTAKIDRDSIAGDCGEYSCYSAQGGAVSIVTRLGWNLISNPCLTNITGTNIQVTVSAVSAACGGDNTCTLAEAVSAGYVRNTVYRWNGYNYSTDAPVLTSGGKAEPWKGYWFYAMNTTPFATGITYSCGTQ
jgi:hypothetical protein